MYLIGFASACSLKKKDSIRDHSVSVLLGILELISIANSNCLLASKTFSLLKQGVFQVPIMFLIVQ